MGMLRLQLAGIQEAMKQTQLQVQWLVNQTFAQHCPNLEMVMRIEDGTWPASLLDAAQGMRDTAGEDELHSDGQQQQPTASHRQQSR